MNRAALVALAALAGCRERPAGVPVGQADDAPPPAPWRSDALDSVYADSLPLFPLDSLALDSAAADTLAVARAPTPTAAWEAVRAAVRSERRAAWDAATDGAPGAADTFDDATGDFRDGLLALAPRDLIADGDAREARVTVGYDDAGRVVPQDEAETDRTLVVRLDVAGGAYRVVRVRVE